MATRPASKPLVIAALGGRGSGKSAWVKQHPAVIKARRLVVWDFMREYADQVDQVLHSLPECIRAMGASTWRIAYQPDPSRKTFEFERLCMAVKVAKRCTFVAEELAFVTTPSKAPPMWRELCLLGRHATHAESTIIGISQRPASIDKDFLSCADVIHCGRLAHNADARAVAPYLGADWRELAQLADLHYIEKEAGRPDPVRGKLTFAAPNARRGGP